MVTLQPPHPCSVFFHPIWCPLSLLDRPPKSVSSTLSVPSLLTKVNPIKNLLFRLQLIPSWTSNVQGCTQSNIFPLEPVLLMDMAGLFNTHHQCVEMIRFKLSLGNLFVFSESWPSFILWRVARTVGSHLALALAHSPHLSLGFSDWASTNIPRFRFWIFNAKSDPKLNE